MTTGSLSDINPDVLRTAKVALLAAGGTASRLEAALREAAKTDSPIEAICAAVFTVARDHLLSEGHSRFLVSLRPQVWAETYRLDFAIEPMDRWLKDALEHAGIAIRVGVELDGHEFHERTKAQVIARDRRDRQLSSAGWRILHFSGSELTRNPMTAVVEVLVAGADALDEAKAALFHR